MSDILNQMKCKLANYVVNRSVQLINSLISISMWLAICPIEKIKRKEKNIIKKANFNWQDDINVEYTKRTKIYKILN